MSKITYSIIVPIYNVEDYLEECIKSILQQKSNYAYEIILVDDGSTDNSSTICDRYISNDKVKVIHQQNSGVSSARNTGIEQSCGKYILFVDGDDFWENELLSTLDEYVENKCDTVMFSYLKLKDGRKNNVNINGNIKGISGKNYLNMLFSKNCSINSHCWIYMFNREIIITQNLRFDITIKNAEDLDFIMKYIPFAQELYVIDLPLYVYRCRIGSVTQSVKYENIITDLEIYAKYFNLYKNSALANRFTRVIAVISFLDNKQNLGTVAEIIEKHKRILKYTTGVECSFIRSIINLLGVHRGLETLYYIYRIYYKLKNRS